MSNLLSQTTINSFTGAFGNLFNTLATTEITVYKEPIKVINNTSINLLPGYTEEVTDIQDVTYTPRFQTFSGIAIYPIKSKGSKGAGFLNDKINLNPNQTYIKVSSECRDYIMNDKTENIQFNGETYLWNGTTQVQNYYGLRYYYFELNATS